MKTSLSLARLLLVVCAFVCIELPLARAADSVPTVNTDLEDYPPFSVVWITGSGFLPSETVTNQVVQLAGPDPGAAYEPWGVVADTEGNFETSWYVFGDELAGTTLELTATGADSGLVARTQFADSIGALGSIGTGAATSAGVTTTISPVTAAAGNSIIVAFAMDDPSGLSGTWTNITATDSAGNTYTVDKDVRNDAGTSTSGDGVRTVVFSARVTTPLSGGTITISHQSVTERAANAFSFSGLVASSPVDQSAANAASGGTTGTPASVGPTLATTQADELVFAAFGYEEGIAFNAGGGYTGFARVRSDNTTGTGVTSIGAAYSIVPATGAQSATATFGGGSGTTADYAAAIVTYKAAPFVKSVSSTAADGAYTVAAVIPVTMTFNVPVNVTGTPQLALNAGGGAVATYVSGSGSVTLAFNYTVASGQNNSDLDYSSTSALTLNGGTIKDAGGNDSILTLPSVGGANSLGGQKNLLIDTAPPTITIGAPSATATKTGPVTYSVTYSGANAVTLSTSDITLNTTGTATASVGVSGTGTATRTVTLSSITGDGTIGISIAAGTATDTAGNSAPAAGPSATFSVDNTAPAAPSTPDLAASSDTGSSNTDNITSDTTPTFTGTAEAGSTVRIFDGATQVGTGTATGGNYTLSTSALSQGAHSITATATDTAGNVSSASGPLSITIDSAVPTVTVNQAVGQADPTTSVPVHFTVVFSEAVSGFTTTDVSLGGTAAGRSVTSVTDSGDQKTYDVAVTATSAGTITATVPSGGAQDLAGNLNNNSTSGDNNITYDPTAPTKASVTTPANGSIFRAATVPANFSGVAADANSGLNADSTTFTLQRGSDNFYWTGSVWQAGVFNLATTHTAGTGDKTWTSASGTLPTWASQSDGLYTMRATATDKAGNTFTGTAVSFTLDNTAPTTVSVILPANGVAYMAGSVPANFSGSAADNTGGVGLNASSTTFTLRRASDGLYWNGSGFTSATPVNRTTTHSATTSDTAAAWTNSSALPNWSLQSAGTYTVQTKATDKASNTNTSTATSFTLLTPIAPTSIGTDTDNNSSHITLNVPATVAVGNTIFVAVAMDPTASVVTVSDSSGNSYTNDAAITNSGSGGVRTMVFSAPVTNALSSGGSITVNFPSPTPANKVASFFSFNGLVSPSQDKSSTNTGTGSTLNSGNTATTSQSDELLIGALGLADNGVTYSAFSDGFVAVPSGDASVSGLSIQAIYAVTNATGSYAAAGSGNKSAKWAAAIVTYKLAVPRVVSIVRADPNPSAASSVDFTVTFSENVYNVATTDFVLATTGVSGASITSVTGGGTSYTVSVNTGTGGGTIGLNLVDDDSIVNLNTIPLGGTGSGNGNFTGEVYTMCTAPSLTCPAASSASADTSCQAAVPDVTGSVTVSGGCGPFEITQSPAAGTIVGLGPHTITVTASNSIGQSSPCTTTFTVNDTTAPVISLAGANPQVIECHTSYSELGATASDSCAGDLSSGIVINASAVNVNAVGSYTVSYNVSDPSGNPAATVTRTVTVVDTTPAVVTVTGANPMTVECHTSYSELGATANDSCAGDLSSGIVIDASAVNVNAVGSYTVSYNVSDPSGNPAATVTRTVTVVDTTPAVVTVTGANPMTVECHTSYSELGATALDSCAGDISGSIVISGNVDANTVGSYTITYTVSDGHNTSSATRTVNVVDTTAPVAPGIANATGQCSVTVTAPTATDNCEGSVTGTTSDPLTYNTQGTFIVHWTFNDGNGNISTANQTVIVNDTQNPTITAPSALSLANDAGACSRALAHISLGTPVTADNCGVATVSNNAPSSFPVGNTTVTWTVMDIHGRSATATQIVTINDTEAPELVDPANMTVSDGNPMAFGTTATDNCGTQGIVFKIGSTVVTSPCAFPVGTTMVDVTATDIHGNTATCQFTVTRAVSCQFTGFLSPIGGADATGGSFADPLRAFKLGSTVPVKFRLVCGGVPNTTGVHTLQAIKYSSSITSDIAVDATPTDAATTGNQFRLTDASTGDWHFNLSTKSFSKGIWKLVATLSDGSEHVVWIEIKK